MAKNPKDKDKKGKEEVPAEMDFVDRAISGLESMFDGPGMLVSGKDIVDEKKIVVPISPALDILTWGGIEEGAWVVIAGPEKTGKTVCSLQIAANGQKPEFGDRMVFYAAVEGRIDRKTLSGIKGLDLSPKKFQVIRSRAGKVLTSQDYLKAFQHILNTVPKCVLIIDSISTLLDDRVATDGIGTETRSSGYKYVSQFVDLMTGTVPAQGSIVIAIARQIANTGGGMAKKYDKMPSCFKYQHDYLIRTTHKKPLLATGRQVGQIVFWQCAASKLGAPGRKIESYLRYGVGFDADYENLILGITAQLIKKSGAWYSFDFLAAEPHKHLLPEDGEIPKAQGQEAAYKLLCENPEWLKALSTEVAKFGDILAGTTAEEE